MKAGRKRIITKTHRGTINFEEEQVQRALHIGLCMDIKGLSSVTRAALELFCQQTYWLVQAYVDDSLIAEKIWAINESHAFEQLYDMYSDREVDPVRAEPIQFILK
jgi:hypothetical protein